MMCEMVDHDELYFMREHHGIEEKIGHKLHGVHETTSQKDIMIEWSIYDVHVDHHHFTS